MPLYDYKCEKCEVVVEILHEMSDSEPKICTECQSPMVKQFSSSFTIMSGKNGTIESHKEREHRKKVKDFDRAVKRRKKMFGSDSVGQPVDKPAEKHIIRKGRTIAGQDIKVDRQQFIKSAAKDNHMVEAAKKALQNKKN